MWTKRPSRSTSASGTGSSAISERTWLAALDPIAGSATCGSSSSSATSIGASSPSRNGIWSTRSGLPDSPSRSKRTSPALSVIRKRAKSRPSIARFLVPHRARARARGWRRGCGRRATSIAAMIPAPPSRSPSAPAISRVDVRGEVGSLGRRRSARRSMSLADRARSRASTCAPPTGDPRRLRRSVAPRGAAGGAQRARRRRRRAAGRAASDSRANSAS